MSENLVPELCRTKEQIRAVAEEQGLICIFPEADELQLDIDQPFGVYNATQRKRVEDVLAQNGINIVSTLITESKSGNTHIYLKLDQGFEDYLFRITLQAAMGSDPVRETLSFLRYRAESEAPIALFETGKAAKDVFQWRKYVNDGALAL